MDAIMRARTFYTLVILLPAVALAAAVQFAGDPTVDGPPIPAGATEVWLYPRFGLRELAAYGLVAAWLLWELRLRTPSDFARLVWWAPVALAVAGILMLMPFVLAHGAARQLLADDGGRIALGIAVRLAMGYGYIALAVFAWRNMLQVDLVEYG
jgi:hypothetical protein